jgi:hypothetical protein
MDLGALGTQSETTVINSLDVSIGIFTDESFSKTLSSSMPLMPSSIFNLGVVSSDKTKTVQASYCWASSIILESSHAEAGDEIVKFVIDGCPNELATDLENYSNNQARIEVSSSIFDSFTSSEAYIQCDVYVLDAMDNSWSIDECGSTNPVAIGSPTRVNTMVQLEIADACAVNDCEGTCTNTFNGKQCACPLGETLKEDGISCLPTKKKGNGKWNGKWKKKPKRT